jgi:ComF family protein
MPSWLASIREFARWTVDLVLPPTCLGCDVPGHRLWCPTCVRSAPPGLTDPCWVDGVPLLGAFSYVPPVSDAVKRFKYSGRTDLAPRLGRLMAACVTHDVAPNLVVPVPLHRRRLVRRGFNQSVLLAREVARELRVPCAPRALLRIKDTPQQARQDRAQRLENMRGAFRARFPAALAFRRVLLVDDVVTTGATVRGCIHVLRAAGAEVVGVSSLCMTLDQ